MLAKSLAIVTVATAPELLIGLQVLLYLARYSGIRAHPTATAPLVRQHEVTSRSFGQLVILRSIRNLSSQMKPLVKILGNPHYLHRLECGECGWSISVLAETDAELKQCPWCGWEDLEISKLLKAGAGQRISCSEHGEVTVEVLTPSVSTDDFGSDLFCPFCAGLQ